MCVETGKCPRKSQGNTDVKVGSAMRKERWKGKGWGGSLALRSKKLDELS